MKLAQADFLKLFGGTTLLAKQVASELVRPPLYVSLIIEQVYQIGIRLHPLSICHRWQHRNGDGPSVWSGA